MTSIRDVHVVPYEGSFPHKADRRCPCAPKPMRDLNVPQRLVFVHRQPPMPGPTLRYPGEPIA